MRVILIAALSLDGFIAQRPDQVSTEWTTSSDKRLFSRVTKQVGVIAMGSKTFDTIGHALPGRHMVVYTKGHRDSIEGVEFTQKDPAQLVAEMEAAGAKGLAVCGGAQIYDLFMQAGLINEVYVSIQPVVFGQGVALFNQAHPAKLSLVDTQTNAEDGSLIAHYRVNAL